MKYYWLKYPDENNVIRYTIYSSIYTPLPEEFRDFLYMLGMKEDGEFNTLPLSREEYHTLLDEIIQSQEEEEEHRFTTS